jgi:hypothetical protein
MIFVWIGGIVVWAMIGLIGLAFAGGFLLFICVSVWIAVTGLTHWLKAPLTIG